MKMDLQVTKVNALESANEIQFHVGTHFWRSIPVTKLRHNLKTLFCLRDIVALLRFLGHLPL